MMEKVEKIKTKLVFISRQTSNNRCDCSTYPVRKGQPVFINDDLTCLEIVAGPVLDDTSNWADAREYAPQSVK